MKTKVCYVAVNQYGETKILGKHPRKELLEYHYVKHADKMYTDDENGNACHIGYVIAGNWYTLYKISGKGI